jgi:hypothetical protein
LHHLLRKGLEATAPLWPPIQRAYAFVHQAAHVLANHEEADAATVRLAYQALLVHMTAQQGQLGSLAAAVTHFRTVTASYWPGLFHCYDVPALPRTVPRPGAVFWNRPPPGATGHWPQGRFPRRGGAWGGAGGR